MQWIIVLTFFGLAEDQPAIFVQYVSGAYESQQECEGYLGAFQYGRTTQRRSGKLYVTSTEERSQQSFTCVELPQLTFVVPTDEGQGPQIEKP